MIKSTEVRLGNFINGTDGKINKVTLKGMKYLKEYETNNQATPIILTKERLVEWCGFKNERYEANEFHIDVKAGMTTDFVLEATNNQPIGGSFFTFYVKMGRVPLTKTFTELHDLQNFFFAFWGYELEVNIPDARIEE